MVQLVLGDPFQNWVGGGKAGSAGFKIRPSIGIERGLDKIDV